MPSVDERTGEKLDEQLDALSDPTFFVDRPWTTIVWDDPVNLMSYVTYVFMTLFNYSEERATQLMLQVHNEGKAVVSSGRREEMERDVSRLHEYGLWATLARDDK